MNKTLSYNRSIGGFRSMLAVDLRRMFRTGFFYLMFLITTALPILVLVMTTMNADPTQSGAMFTSTWQAFGSIGSGMGMTMDITSMCNINMVYFIAAVLVGCFVSADFKSGYAKNIFSVRPDKGTYIASKMIVCFVACVLLLAGYTIGAFIGGAIAGLPFAMEGFTAMNLVMCLISKALLMAVFTGVYLLTSVIAREKTWLALILSFCVGMLLFTMIPIITPLTSTMMNVILCLAGGSIFAAGFGIVGRFFLGRVDLI